MRKDDGQIVTKKEIFETIPLFLADEYKSIYDKSYSRFDARSPSPQKRSLSRGKDEAKKAKGASKMYRNKFLQDKVLAQADKAKKNRGRKPAGGGGGDGTKGKGKNKAKTEGEQVAELMDVVQELRNDAEFREEEVETMREQIEMLKK